MFGAPGRIAVTFDGGSLHDKWCYLPGSPYEYRSPSGERYVLAGTVWHSDEDGVISHQVYVLEPLPVTP